MFDCSKVVPKKCQAECCYYVPIPKELWEKYKDKAQRKTRILKWDTRNGEWVMPLTESMRCPFVDKDFRCVIYKERSWLCKMFGTKNIKGLKCAYLKPSGNKRGKKQRSKLSGANEKSLNVIAEKINRIFDLASQGKDSNEILEIMKKEEK